MTSVRIKYYGILLMTKRGYLVATAVASVIMALVLLGGLAAGKLPPLSTIQQPPRAGAGEGTIVWLYNHLYQIIVVGVILEIVDILVVLHRFRRLGIAQQAASAEVQPTNSPS
jgi:hypothetical protein